MEPTPVFPRVTLAGNELRIATRRKIPLVIELKCGIINLADRPEYLPGSFRAETTCNGKAKKR